MLGDGDPDIAHPPLSPYQIFMAKQQMEADNTTATPAAQRRRVNPHVHVDIPPHTRHVAPPPPPKAPPPNPFQTKEPIAPSTLPTKKAKSAKPTTTDVRAFA